MRVSLYSEPTHGVPRIKPGVDAQGREFQASVVQVILSDLQGVYFGVDSPAY